MPIRQNMLTRISISGENHSKPLPIYDLTNNVYPQKLFQIM